MARIVGRVGISAKAYRRLPPVTSRPISATSRSRAAATQFPNDLTGVQLIITGAAAAHPALPDPLAPARVRRSPRSPLPRAPVRPDTARPRTAGAPRGADTGQRPIILGDAGPPRLVRIGRTGREVPITQRGPVRWRPTEYRGHGHRRVVTAAGTGHRPPSTTAPRHQDEKTRPAARSSTPNLLARPDAGPGRRPPRRIQLARTGPPRIAQRTYATYYRRDSR